MRGATLISLLNDYRAEARLSLNPSANAQDRAAQVITLQRVQKFLWEDFNWPFMRVTRDVQVAEGSRFYNMPIDLDFERIESMRFRSNSQWHPILYPTMDDSLFNVWDSDLGETSWPVRAWRFAPNNQFEVWPIPNDNFDPYTLDGTIRITGIRTLAPMVNDGDRAELDDQLIVLHAAAERLASSGAKDAQYKLDQAQKRYARLRGEFMTRKTFNMFRTTQLQPRGPVTTYVVTSPKSGP